MEGRLFVISLWCGLYGLALRQVYKFRVNRNVYLTVAFNSLFWATVGFIFGMLRASYSAGAEFNLHYSIFYAIVGVGFGVIMGYWRGREEPKREKLLKDNLEWAETGFSAILLASVVMFFVIQAFKIPSGSMRMTFVEGDHLFVNKFIYGIPIPFSDRKLFPLETPERGDIVIFRFPSDDKESPHYGKDFIKRVVAVAGETVQIKNKVVFVNGKPLDEPYAQHVDNKIYAPPYEYDPVKFQVMWEKGEFAHYLGNEIRDNFGPVVVPEGDLMVMGDNRDRSFDSRFWGPLPMKEIKGKAFFVYWPPSRMWLVRHS